MPARAFIIMWKGKGERESFRVENDISYNEPSPIHNSFLSRKIEFFKYPGCSRYKDRLFPFSLFSTFYHRFLSNQIFVPFVHILSAFSSRVSEIKNRSVKSVFIAIPCINNTLGEGEN